MRVVAVLVGADVVWEGSDTVCSSVHNNDGDPARDCDSNPSAASNPATAAVPLSVPVARAAPCSFSLALASSSTESASSSSSSSCFIFIKSNFRFFNGRDEEEDEEDDEQAATGEGVDIAAAEKFWTAVVVGEDDMDVDDGELMHNNLTGFSFRLPASSS